MIIKNYQQIHDGIVKNGQLPLLGQSLYDQTVDCHWHLTSSHHDSQSLPSVTKVQLFVFPRTVQQQWESGTAAGQRCQDWMSGMGDWMS